MFILNDLFEIFFLNSWLLVILLYVHDLKNVETISKEGENNVCKNIGGGENKIISM